MCNLCAPNNDDLDFFTTLTMHIDTLQLEDIIIDSYFNFIVTNSLEILNRHSNNWKVRNCFIDWAENKCLVDVFKCIILRLKIHMV